VIHTVISPGRTLLQLDPAGIAKNKMELIGYVIRTRTTPTVVNDSLSSMTHLYPWLEECWIVLGSLVRLVIHERGPYHQALVTTFGLDPGLTPRHPLQDGGFSSISSTHNQDAKLGTLFPELYR